MNRQQRILAVVAVVLIGAAAALIVRLKSHQKLGAPGVKTVALADGRIARVELPEKVLDYGSKFVEPDAIVTNILPRDTSYGQRLYTAPDEFWVELSVVLMGSDRTSLHKPEFCLRGAGWRIDTSDELTIPMTRPQPYELPVIRKLVTKQIALNGQPTTVRGVYVYWFVADHALSGDASGAQRMWWMAKGLLTTGVLQRWAYVTCFAVCAPGQEEATFARLKQFIAAAAPQFQLAAGAADAGAARVRQAGGF